MTSILGVGTTVHVLLPIATESAVENASAARTEAVQGNGRRVLYVDDEDAMVFLVERLLKIQGYIVEGYTDTHKALQAITARASEFDLVVTDFNMPGHSGLDIAAAVANVRSDLPVVITSGYIDDRLREGARRLNICEIVHKPNTVDELCAALGRILSSKRGASEA